MTSEEDRNKINLDDLISEIRKENLLKGIMTDKDIDIGV